MKLIKGKREARWLPFDWALIKQIRHGTQGRKYGYVEFDGTKEELAIATRLGRLVPRHRAWVNMSSLMEHDT